MNTKPDLISQMLIDLQLYDGCKVCIHCNRKIYPCDGYCKLNGCNGGGSGKIKENMWQYRGVYDGD